MRLSRATVIATNSSPISAGDARGRRKECMKGRRCHALSLAGPIVSTVRDRGRGDARARSTRQMRHGWSGRGKESRGRSGRRAALAGGTAWRVGGRSPVVGRGYALWMLGPAAAGRSVERSVLALSLLRGLRCTSSRWGGAIESGERVVHGRATSWSAGPARGMVATAMVTKGPGGLLLGRRTEIEALDRLLAAVTWWPGQRRRDGKA